MLQRLSSRNSDDLPALHVFAMSAGWYASIPMMKRLLMTLIVLLASACGTRPANSESDVRELTQLENSISVASTTGDSVFLDWVMDSRFVMILENGRKLSREELIARWTATDPTTSDPSFQMDDLEVLVDGHPPRSLKPFR